MKNGTRFLKGETIYMTAETRIKVLIARKNLLLSRQRDNSNIVKKIDRQIRNLETKSL